MIAANSHLIGIAFSKNKPDKIGKVNYSDKYCRFIGSVRKGESFYISENKISCPLARYHLGIYRKEIDDLAQTLVGWSDAIDQKTGIKYLKEASLLSVDFNHISFLSFPEPEIQPQLIIRISSADSGQKMVQRYSARTGRRAFSPISGIGAACGECTSYVLNNDVPVISLGCNGSRPGIGLSRGELLVAAPASSEAAGLIQNGN